MNEIIVKMTGDHIKIKGGEYVQDLVRCKECTRHEDINAKEYEGICLCRINGMMVNENGFCSFGERRGADDE